MLDTLHGVATRYTLTRSVSQCNNFEAYLHQFTRCWQIWQLWRPGDLPMPLSASH